MFKYINPGDYRLLNNRAGSGYSNSNNETHAPVSKMAYTSTNTGDYPITVDDGTTELWMKFDLYLADTCTLVLVSPDTTLNATVVFSSDKVSVGVGHKAEDPSVDYLVNLIENIEAAASMAGKKSTIRIHIKSGDTTNYDGLFELYINNVKKINVANLAILNGASIRISTLKSLGGSSWFSNIIVSDTEVKGRENTIALPIAETVTDGWSEEEVEGGGKRYTTNEVYKTITQTIDIPALKVALGVEEAENMEITGIAIQVNEMSTDDNDAINAIGKYIELDETQYKIGTSVIDNTPTSIMNVSAKNPGTNENWTLENLGNLSLILKTEKVIE